MSSVEFAENISYSRDMVLFSCHDDDISMWFALDHGAWLLTQKFAWFGILCECSRMIICAKLNLKCIAAGIHIRSYYQGHMQDIVKGGSCYCARAKC